MKVKKNKLVIIVGAPRTGTSLTCDLVKALGFNFGQTFDNGGNRTSRNDLSEFYGGMGSVTATRTIRTIEKYKIKAIKIVHLLDWWLPLFINIFDCRFIITTRNKKDTQNSQLEIVRANWRGYNKHYETINTLLSKQKYFVSPFEIITTQNKEHLEKLIKFLDKKPKEYLDKLTKTINIEGIKYKENNNNIDYLKDLLVEKFIK